MSKLAQLRQLREARVEKVATRPTALSVNAADTLTPSVNTKAAPKTARSDMAAYMRAWRAKPRIARAAREAAP